MTVKAILQDLENLDEALKSHYVEKDGKFVLDVEAVGDLSLEDVGGLKKALAQERANVEAAAKTVKDFDGIDPAKAKQAFKDLEEFKNFDPDQKIEAGIKSQREALVAKHTQTVEDMGKKYDGVMEQLEKNLVVASATKAISEAGGTVELLLPHVKSSIKMKQNEAGTFIAEVVDKEGLGRVGDGQGNPMTIPQLVDEFKGNELFSPAFKGSGSSGTGAGAGTGGGAGESTQGAPVVGADGKKTVDANDQHAVNSNLEAIAKGDVTVSTPG